MLKRNLTKPKKPNNSSSKILSKFQRKNDDILEEMYKNRNEKIKGQGGSSGRSIFNLELLEQLGLEEINPSNKNLKGENYFEILPISFNSDEPYFMEIPVHRGIGSSFDDFICMKKFAGKPCYRCKVQTELYSKLEEGQKPGKDITSLYPSDRIIYLVWWRTQELSDEVKEQERIEKISILNAPKNKFHSEILEQVKDKKKKRHLDISDPAPGGDGRTVYYKMQYVDKFPNYLGFSLLERDDEGLPDSILEKLNELIEFAKEQGKENIFECLLEYHTDDELKEVMKNDMVFSSSSNSSNKKLGTKHQSKEETEEETEDEIDLEALKELLEEKTLIKIKFWAKSKGLGEIVEDKSTKDAMIEAILEYYEEENQE